MSTTPELDPRDKLLQDHSPAVMVPRFGELAPLDKPGHRYLVAADGLWLEVRRAWLHARVPLSLEEPNHRLPFGTVERVIEYKLRDQDVADLQERFLCDARAAMPNEFAAWGVYDSLTGGLEYHPLIAIAASPGGIEFHRPTLGLNEHLAMDLHSHGRLAAFFSSTDDADDSGEVKIAVVVGELDQQPEWETRLCLHGLFIMRDEDLEEELPDV